MRIIKRILPLLMAVIMIFSCIPLANAIDDTATIRDILYYYGQHQDKAETDIIRLLDTLSQENKEKWEKILTCWHQAYEEQDNIRQIPENLPDDESLCIIVMGYSLHANGTMKEELLGRLQTALDILRDHPNAYILCTGGGTAAHNPSITEADSMAKWLLAQGVSKEKIIIENRAYSTEDNAINTFRILKEQYPEIDTVLLVSSDYHLRRCKLLFYAETVLKGLDDRYTIAGWAGFDAGHEGAEDPPNDAESLGPMVGVYIDKGYVPKLSVLTEIVVEGNESCMVGDPPPIAVSACYSGGYFRDVTNAATVTGFDPLLAGTQRIVISYEENGISLSETREITVIPLPTETTQPPVPTTSEPSTIPETEAVEQVPEESSKPVLLLAICVLLTLCAVVALTVILKRRK